MTYYTNDKGNIAKVLGIDDRTGLAKVVINDKAVTMAWGVVKQTSTTKATTKQFTEHLNDIERWAYAKGYALPQPEELIWAIR